MNLPTAASRTVAGGGNSMLPLINVVFLLMVFFMLVGSMSARDVLEIEPAQAQQLTLAGASSATLVIAADGRLGWGQQIFTLDQLKAKAATWQARDAGQTLEVKADAALEARVVVDILGVLREAGIAKVKLLAANAR